MIRSEIQRLLGDLRSTRQHGSFARNVMFTFRGNAMVTLSQLVLTPIVARLYGPAAYGLYGLFIALSANLATVAELGYTPAYMLPADRSRFHDLVRLNFFFLAMVLIALLPVLVARDAVFALFPAWAALGNWFYLLPLGVMAIALPSFLIQWLFREKAFAVATNIGGGTNLALRLFNIGYGLLNKGALHGLITGELLVRAGQVVVLRAALLRHGWHEALGHWRLKDLLNAARTYARYPLMIFPERWLALGGVQVPVFLLAASPEAVGRYAFATGLLALPLRQIGYSLSTVFQQKAAEVERERPHDLPGITLGLYRRLLIIGAPLFAIGTFFGDAVFALLLGETWRVSGAYAAVLAPFFFLRLLTEPIASLAYVKRAEHLLLWFQAVLLVLRIAVMLQARPMGVGTAIVAYAAVSALGYLVFAALLLRAARLPLLRVMPRTALWIAACGGAAALLRFTVLGSWWPAL